MLHVFCNNKKPPKTIKPTIGADFMTIKTELDSGEEVNVQLWDTAGQERFQSLCQNFYRGSDCCILAFDLTRPETYESLD